MTSRYHHTPMILVILVGMVYAIWANSLVVAILTAALVLYRAQRPSRFMARVREAWYRRQMGASDDSVA